MDHYCLSVCCGNLLTYLLVCQPVYLAVSPRLPVNWFICVPLVISLDLPVNWFICVPLVLSLDFLSLFFVYRSYNI